MDNKGYRLIRTMLDETDTKQKELAEKLGCSPQNISIRINKRNTYIEFIDEIANVLGYSLVCYYKSKTNDIKIDTIIPMLKNETEEEYNKRKSELSISQKLITNLLLPNKLIKKPRVQQTALAETLNIPIRKLRYKLLRRENTIEFLEKIGEASGYEFICYLINEKTKEVIL